MVVEVAPPSPPLSPPPMVLTAPPAPTVALRTWPSETAMFVQIFTSPPPPPPLVPPPPAPPPPITSTSTVVTLAGTVQVPELVKGTSLVLSPERPPDAWLGAAASRAAQSRQADVVSQRAGIRESTCLTGIVVFIQARPLERATLPGQGPGKKASARRQEFSFSPQELAAGLS